MDIKERCVDIAPTLPLGEVLASYCYWKSIGIIEAQKNESEKFYVWRNYITEHCSGEFTDNYWPINKILFCWARPISRYYRSFIFPIIVILGVFGNIMAIKIFILRTEIKGTCRIYYLYLAIADLVYLLNFGMPEFISNGLDHLSHGSMQFWPDKLSEASCKLIRFFMHSSWFMSCWILVIYSFERVLAISYPFMRVSFINCSTAKKICFGIIVVTIGIFSPIIYTNIYVLTNANNVNFAWRTCFVDYNQLSAIGFIWIASLSILFTILVPPILVLIANSILLVKLNLLAKERHRLMHGRNENSRIEVKNAKDLVLLSILMLVFNLPTLSWLPYICIDEFAGIIITYLLIYIYILLIINI